MEHRGLSFLESLAISAATGAITGAIRGAADTPREDGERFTKAMIDTTLYVGDRMKRMDRDGYIPGL